MWSEWHLRKNHPAAVVRMGALPVEAAPVEAVPAVARTVAAAPEAVRTVAAAPKAVHQAVPPTADLKLLRHRTKQFSLM